MNKQEKIREELRRLGYKYDVLRCGWHYGNNVTFIRPFGISDKELVELFTEPLVEIAQRRMR